MDWSSREGWLFQTTIYLGQWIWSSNLREVVIETKLKSIRENIVPLWHSFIRKRKPVLAQNQLSFFPVLLTNLRTFPFQIFFLNWNIIPTFIRCCIYFKNLRLNAGYSTCFTMLLHSSMVCNEKGRNSLPILWVCRQEEKKENFLNAMEETVIAPRVLG